MPRHTAASCGLHSMRKWGLRSSTRAWASPKSAARGWASPRCVSAHLSWAAVASSSLSRRAVPKCWSVCHCPTRVPRSSENDGYSTHPRCRRPPSLQEGHDLAALIGARVRSCRRGKDGRGGRSACRTPSARRNLDGPADAKGERYRGYAKDPPTEPEHPRAGGNALRG